MYVIKQLIEALVDVYTLILFIYVLMSWIPIKTGIVEEIYAFLGRLCDPYLDLFRRFIPPIGGMVDISPIIAVIVLQFVEKLIVSIL